MDYRFEFYEFSWILERDDLWKRVLPSLVKTSVENPRQTLLYKFLNELRKNPITNELKGQLFGNGLCLIVEKASQAVVGTVCFTKIGILEAITIFEEFRKKGIASMTMKTIHTLTLTHNIHLVCNIDKDDFITKKILTKAGFLKGEKQDNFVQYTNKEMTDKTTYENQASDYGNFILEMCNI
jgi:hypothetical protein